MEVLQSGPIQYEPFTIACQNVLLVLTDFRGQQEYLDIVLDACPDIFNHNLETVKRLQRPIRKLPDTIALYGLRAR